MLDLIKQISNKLWLDEKEIMFKKQYYEKEWSFLPIYESWISVFILVG